MMILSITQLENLPAGETARHPMADHVRDWSVNIYFGQAATGARHHGSHHHGPPPSRRPPLRSAPPSACVSAGAYGSAPGKLTSATVSAHSAAVCLVIFSKAAGTLPQH